MDALRRFMKALLEKCETTVERGEVTLAKCKNCDDKCLKNKLSSFHLAFFQLVTANLESFLRCFLSLSSIQSSEFQWVKLKQQKKVSWLIRIRKFKVSTWVLTKLALRNVDDCRDGKEIDLVIFKRHCFPVVSEQPLKNQCWRAVTGKVSLMFGCFYWKQMDYGTRKEQDTLMNSVKILSDMLSMSVI